jgi:tRNA-specific 2-thiouridylase
MRVVVAMSGGVDSAVTAALMVEAGYDVVGITLQLYDYGAATAKPGSCCAGQDIRDAARVAEQLGIPHYVLDYEARFRQGVIDDFAASYARGETPIPCVRCNQTVKFHDLLGTARDLGAAAMATGHYARRVEGKNGPELHQAVDDGRDQSYFLFATTQDQLDYVRFPLGDFTKDETRAVARRLGLTVQDKKDSQDICFVPQGHYSAMVEKLRPDAVVPGEIVHVDGRVLGRHDGVIHYTVGQRKGIGVAASDPLYVVRLDAPAARVIVGPRSALGADLVTVRDVNWLTAAPAIGEERHVQVKLRSAQPMRPACLSVNGAGATIRLAEPQEGIAPGQACVFYHGTQVLGGGWIARRSAAGLVAA